ISIAKLGLFLGKIYFQLSGFDKKGDEEMYSYLLSDKRISWISKCEGRWDLLLGAYVEDILQLNGIKNDFFSRYGKYVNSYDILFATEASISQRTYLVGEKAARPRKVERFIGKGKAKVSQTDKKILKLIANNARFSYVSLAQELGISPKTVQTRVRELEKAGVIQGYLTFLNPNVLGYNFSKICIYLRDYEGEMPSFLKYCSELPNVIHIIESLGPWDVELEAETKSMADFYALTHDIRDKFPGIVNKIEHVMILEEKKLDFLPEWY
ncbi:MAG: Lrp/AsnC family transcriptional regulator, partial [Candidatus Micrarchaeota archaeon]|nr:Lrp/AsnC family transcriptional regulator [Candidatus Micrarchaeota archaeon]